ncbi:unnamed protein product [Lymnaea stagnalis]|uniref:Zinc transporter ZIP12 n=1 Tax=Lymnaea stagnalis TaxID=6523 RepID=A0AAV2IC62_LYMST
MCKKIFIAIFIAFLAEMCESVENRPPRLDVFHELIKKADPENKTETLSVDQLENYIHGLVDRLSCTGNEGAQNPTQDITSRCNQTICFNTRQLVALVDGDLEAGLNEGQLRNVSVLLLFYVARIDDVCHTTPDLVNATAASAHEYLSNRTSGPGGVQAMLDAIEPHVSHDHAGHVRRRRRSPELRGTARDSKRHSRAVDDGTGEHTHPVSYLVIQDKCLNADAVHYYMRSEQNEAALDVGQLATLVVYMLYSGYQIQPKCRILPSQDSFIDNLFLHFGDGQMIHPDGFDLLMENLGIEPASSESSGVHTHERKKRDARTAVSQVEGHSARRKRQAHSDFAECYSAEQLLALFDSSEGLNKSHFQVLAPSLISQKLYGDCTAKSQISSVSDAEKYGYGTVAIFIICLCSIFGVVFVPCASKKVYDVIMALFLGLAVGTLFADAILHLIPQTMGIHDHGAEEHSHDGAGIVVENYVTYGLAIMAGLYFFYLLELVMSRLGGHSVNIFLDRLEREIYLFVFCPLIHAMCHLCLLLQHSHDEPGQTFDHITPNGDVSDRLPLRPVTISCMTPLAVMIILGDAIHNFADGLAIGAAFTGSVSEGVSTSIAVFCHELPHELGDFAVLLKSGMGFKKALVLNFISALTAFIGLYVGIAASSNDVARAWIFAVTAGMFLYIALVDLLPLLIRSTNALALVLNNLGILLGFAIMLIIAIFEEHIKI